MSRRLPVVPTLVVLAAVLLMVRLGVWQLHRLHEKQALVARYQANAGAAPVPYLSLWPVKPEALYRRVTATCPQVRSWSAEAVHDAMGQAGWRHIALCGTGAEGPGLAIDMGVSPASAAPGWGGGAVTGRLILSGGAPLFAKMFGTERPATPLVVSEDAAPGLHPTASPDPADIPNNHLAYAVQWFLFAGIAAIIYLILLWRRRPPPVAPPPPGR